MSDIFQPCEICGGREWQIRYQGRVRDGAFGNLSKDHCVVAQCPKCGVQRLNESACKEEDFYETEEYRRLLSEPQDAAGFMAKHDVLQLRNLTVLWPESLRYKVVADIGSAAGSFLDHVRGLTLETVSIEPCTAYHDSLRNRGYHVYAFTKDAIPDWTGKIDFAFCFSVIEHIKNPRGFLEEIGALLKPRGKLIVSTPNRMDILMALKGDEYRRFF